MPLQHGFLRKGLCGLASQAGRCRAPDEGRRVVAQPTRTPREGESHAEWSRARSSSKPGPNSRAGTGLLRGGHAAEDGRPSRVPQQHRQSILPHRELERVPRLLCPRVLGSHGRDVGESGRALPPADRSRGARAAVSRQGGGAARLQHPQQDADPRHVPADSRRVSDARRAVDRRGAPRDRGTGGRDVAPLHRTGGRGAGRVSRSGSRPASCAGLVRQARHRSADRSDCVHASPSQHGKDVARGRGPAPRIAVTVRRFARAVAVCALAALAVAAVAGARGEPAETIVVEDWSSQLLGHAGVPVGWEAQNWGQPKYDFTVEEVYEGGRARRVLRLLSDNDNSTISKRVGKIDVKQYPILQWQWRAIQLPAGGDSRKAATDDQAGQLYVVFPRFPPAVRSRIIGYVWDSSAPAGSIFPSASTHMVTYIVVRSGPADLGKWITETRNVLDDYRRVYGAVPTESVEVVSIGIDSNDTRSKAESYLGEIVFRRLAPGQ
ncbi:MAG: hypothetical protein C5B48_06960 [Candidatus Rokuibacteriota bacterium]|nr:MAG: hypothetical protein C5B48_06960 [Candidatus Rokubacteria bacterium]